MSEQENLQAQPTNVIESMKYALGGIASVELLGALAHFGLPGLLVLGAGAGYVTFKHGPQTAEYLQQTFIAPLGLPTLHKTQAIAENDTVEDEKVEEEELFFDEEDELLSPHSHAAPFSTYLKNFTPSLKNIYLASLPDGTPVYSDANGLCHVALAGTTGSGKTNIMRLLMSQLCMAGASVLLLNPHYTRYDITRNEDWTPFEPYLVHDPMECRKYEVIESYLKQIATSLLPKRLEKYAHSQRLGKPYFLVLDELPAIVDNVPDTPKYLAKILREGRKVGIYLVTASQDFLVKTIAPQGGGAVRDCYRTAFYGGGDSTTASKLLDISANQVQENLLGQGTVMLRSSTVKQASLAHIPYVDNQALYRLLGPSTYVAMNDDEDEINLEDLRPTSYRDVPYIEPEVRASGDVPVAKTRQVGVSPELQMALSEYRPGMSYRDFGRALGVGKDKAGELMRELKERRLIV